MGVKERIDILFLSEAHVNTNSTEKHGDYIFFFSTNVTEADRKKTEEAKKKQLAAGKGKGKGMEKGGDSNIEIHNIEAEKLGMAIIHHKKLAPYIVDYVLHDNRNISLVCRGKIGLVTYTCTHVPHDDAEKDKHYTNLENIHLLFSQGQNIHFIGGISMPDL